MKCRERTTVAWCICIPCQGRVGSRAIAESTVRKCSWCGVARSPGRQVASSPGEQATSRRDEGGPRTRRNSTHMAELESEFRSRDTRDLAAVHAFRTDAPMASALWLSEMAMRQAGRTLFRVSSVDPRLLAPSTTTRPHHDIYSATLLLPLLLQPLDDLGRARDLAESGSQRTQR